MYGHVFQLRSPPTLMESPASVESPVFQLRSPPTLMESPASVESPVFQLRSPPTLWSPLPQWSRRRSVLANMGRANVSNDSCDISKIDICPVR